MKKKVKQRDENDCQRWKKKLLYSPIYHVYVLLLHLGISFQPVGTCCKAMKKNKQALPDSKQREQNSDRDEKASVVA